MNNPLYVITRSDLPPFLEVQELIPRNKAHRQSLLCEPALAFLTENEALGRIKGALILRRRAVFEQVQRYDQVIYSVSERQSRLAT